MGFDSRNVAGQSIISNFFFKKSGKVHITYINSILIFLNNVLLIIESGLRSAAVVSYPSPVLVAVVMPQPTPSRSMLAPCK
jgi:hypothetical protein